MNALPYYSEYLDYLKKTGYSSSAMITYGYGLNSFCSYLKERDIQLENISQTGCDEFMAYVRTKNSDRTHNLYMAALKSYLVFLKKYKKIELKINLQNFKKIKVLCREQHRELNWNELASALDKLKSNNSWVAQRNLIILYLVTQTGLKISDLIKLKIGYFSGNKVTFNGADYYLSEEASSALNNFISYKKDLRHPLLFNYRTRHGNAQPLTVRSIERILRLHFDNIKYNDLRLAYFKKLCHYLPDINIIYKHRAVEQSIRIEDIKSII